MEEVLNRFLTESPMAKKVKLGAQVVVQRLSLTPQDVSLIRQAGAFGPIPKKDEICELHIGGRRIAFGKIVKRRGEYFFKLLRPANAAETKEVVS